jgi:hypothetical protein
LKAAIAIDPRPRQTRPPTFNLADDQFPHGLRPAIAAALRCAISRTLRANL